MKEQFLVTPVPIVPPSYEGWIQPLETCIDVGKYDCIDLQLTVASAASFGTIIQIFTGETRDPNDAFVLLATFPTVINPTSVYKIRGICNHQRYIFWGGVSYSTQVCAYIVGTGYYSVAANGCGC